MRVRILVILYLAGALCAQQTERQETSYTYDLNGRRVPAQTYGSTSGETGSGRVERFTTVSGREMPLEKVEEKVIQDNSRGRIVERTIQRFDQDGRPSSTERVRIETRADASGGQTVVSSHYQSDLNGRFALRRRETTQSTTRDNVTDSTSTIEEPVNDGSVRVVQKRVSRLTSQEDGANEDVTIYNINQSGRLDPAARETTETTRAGVSETSTTTRYDTVNFSGSMEFSGQTVTETETRADGTQRKVINTYGAADPGRSIPASSRQARLREQHIIDQQIQRDGTVVETTGVRRVSLSDPNRLEAYHKVSEVECRGQCLTDPSAAEETSTPAEQSSSEEAATPAEAPREVAEREVVIREVASPAGP